MSRVPERLDLDGCALLLGISSRQLRRAVTGGDFAEPSGSDDQNRPYWHKAGVYRWAAQSMSSLADRIPVYFWPTPSAPAAYLGAQAVGASATALGWQTPLGVVWLAWDHAGGTNLPDRNDLLAAASEAFPRSAALVAVGFDFGHDGQALWAMLPGAPREGMYEIQWSQLSRVLSQPVPFWPYALRVPELLKAWQPGSATAVAAPITDLDMFPVLRLAAIEEQGSPAQRVLLNLAQTWQSRAAGSAEQDLEIVRNSAKPGTTTIAANPVEVQETSITDLEESVRRGGWLEVLSRQDNLAAACVRQKIMWDGGRDFPSSNPETIDPHSGHGQEWAQRLVPAPRTAAIEALDSRHLATAVLVDPETDAAVIRDEHGKLHAAIPQRLPATSSLAELILDHPIWVRTQDGTLYPAPKDHYFGLNWGYSGSGPGALAVLADRLLTDINAVAADTINGAPEGLAQLMRKKWPMGTVLTRLQLETARDAPPGTSQGDRL
jgi:hypothetical protein